MIFSRRPGTTLALFVVTSLSAMHPALRGEGDETLGPLREGFLRQGNRIFSAGTGLQESQPQKVLLDIPIDVTIRQVLLYWGLRSDEGDDDLLVDGTTVVGELIGVSSGFPDPMLQPFTYRADITELGVIAPGPNEVDLAGLEIGGMGFANGAEIVVIADDGGPGSLMVRDGADFAYWNFPSPFEQTRRQRFSFDPEQTPRDAELVLIVADHQEFDRERTRPSTLEVGAELDSVLVFDDVLSARVGDSWDCIAVPLTIPASSTFVEAQFFSDTRIGNPYSPSSFYWLFAALRLPETQMLPPVVGDTVFCDLSGDGAQQPGEPGIAGVRVTIVAPAGGGFPGYTADQVTDAEGKYLFRIPGVPDGATLVASVSIDPNTGDAAGKALTTPNPQDTIPLGPGGVDLARDFGLQATLDGEAIVGDTVYCDDNANGNQDEGEGGIGAVTVSIDCPAADGFAGFSAVTSTDNQGRYLFTVVGIPAGLQMVCTVSVDPSVADSLGKVFTTANTQETKPLGGGAMDLDRDFGLAPDVGDALVGDTVYCDLNGNGTQDPGEPGIGGVPVLLVAPPSGDFPGSNQSTTTEENGQYIFTLAGIAPGDSVVATVSIETTSPSAAGKVLSTPNPQETLELTPGAEDRDRDFGLRPLAALVGDTVFCDLNGNGILDSGEPGLAGVQVTLEAPALGSFGGFSDSQVTDAQGQYLFELNGIPPGTPVVATVELDPETGSAAGLELTTPNPQMTVQLGPGSQDLNRDFGLLCTATSVKLCLESKSAPSGESIPVPIVLSSNRPVQGFSIALKHEAGALILEEISFSGTTTELNAADFTTTQIFPDGGTSAAVMDLVAPFLGNTIPVGTDLPIVVYRYSCESLRGDQPRVSPIRFVDGELGSPPKDNLVVIDGLSIAPEVCEGSITCMPEPDRPGPYFVCGGPTLGPENVPVPAVGAPGERAELCFFYCSPEDNLPGHAQFDHVQGLTMAICYDCRLECLEDSFRVPADTITDAIGAEFVSFQCDNDPNDGDGCEMILSILVDANSPFDGRTLPPTEIPLKVACVDVKVAEEVSCGTCLPVTFCDGINGRGRVPAKNLFAAENESFLARTVDCELCVVGASLFLRSDCNRDSSINLADGAAVLSALFGDEFSRFEPPCLDGCDSNDDGRIDIADAVHVLRWLFQDGASPPAPGPSQPGLDPTTDKLDCQALACS